MLSEEGKKMSENETFERFHRSAAPSPPGCCKMSLLAKRKTIAPVTNLLLGLSFALVFRLFVE